MNVKLKRRIATVEWNASPAGDVIADSVVALLMHAQSSAASIRLTSKPCRHPRDSPLPEDDEGAKTTKKQKADDGDATMARLKFILATLKDQFRDVEATYEGKKGTYEITTDCGLDSDVLDEDGKLRCIVSVTLDDTANQGEVVVESKDEKLAANVQGCLRNIVSATLPISTI